MKLIKLLFCVLLVNFFFINPVIAGEVLATPTKYVTSMKKFELCTSSACTTTTLLGEKNQDFDIASATAGADVGSYISSFALEVGTTYTHVRATIGTTFTVAGYITDDNTNSISQDYCVTVASPSTASSHTSPAIQAGSNSTTTADMSWTVPNRLDADNGSFYGDLDASYTTNGITKTNGASTFTWIGALSSSYTPTATSAPKFTMKFDVANKLGEAGDGSGNCGIYMLPPAVTISLTN